MNKQELLNLLTKVLDKQATATETLELIECILRTQISPDNKMFGSFEYIDNTFQSAPVNSKTYSQARRLAMLLEGALASLDTVEAFPEEVKFSSD